LKRTPATQHIPVILLTSRGENSFVKQGYASGCSDFLTKPVNESKLAAAIKKHLGS
jgi:CheY-like chemotaxis protein